MGLHEEVHENPSSPAVLNNKIRRRRGLPPLSIWTEEMLICRRPLFHNVDPVMTESG